MILIRNILCLIALATLATPACWSTTRPAPGPRKNGRDDIRVRAGFEALKDLRCDKGIATLTGPFIEAMRENTPAGRARAARYLCLIAKGFRLDDNIQCYTSLAQMARLLAPNDSYVGALTIEALTRQSKITEAGKLAESYRFAAGKNAYLMRTIGGYYRAYGDDRCMEYLREATRMEPSEPQHWIALGKATRRSKEGIECYSKAVELLPPNSYARAATAALLAQAKGDKAEMLKQLQSAVQLMPHDPAPLLALGMYYAGDGKPEQAFDRFIAASQTPRLSLKAHSTLALFSAFNKQPKLAMTAADRMVALAPYLPESYVARGHVYLTMGKTEPAERDFKRGVELSPCMTGAYAAMRSLPAYAHGKKLHELNDVAVKNMPYRQEHWVAKADALRTDKDWSNALIAYDRAVQLLSGQIDEQRTQYCYAVAGAGVCQYKSSTRSGAIACAKKFNEAKPAPDGLMPVRLTKQNFAKLKDGTREKDAVNCAILADMLYELGEYKDCIAEYKKAIALNDVPEYHRGLLKVYIDSKDYAAALREDFVVSNNTVTRDLPNAIDSIRKQLH